MPRLLLPIQPRENHGFDFALAFSAAASPATIASASAHATCNCIASISFLASAAFSAAALSATAFASAAPDLIHPNNELFTPIIYPNYLTEKPLRIIR